VIIKKFYNISGNVLARILYHRNGINALELYVIQIKKFSKKYNLSIGLKIRLLNWPKNLSGAVIINTCGLVFKYIPTHSDDLRFVARNDLDGWEDSSRKIFKFISQTSDLILDIGAYTGAYSIIGLLANKSSRVMAFEPDLLQSEALRQNLTLNDLESRCQIYQIALSNKAGSVSFFSDASETNYTSTHTIEPGGKFLYNVPSSTIDEIVNGQAVDLIKMDIEGHEIYALEGALQTLKKSKPTILTEALNNRARSDIKQFLESYGYLEIFQLDSRNYLFCHPSKLDKKKIAVLSRIVLLDKI
jgi:FkbM family methyltransferase